MTAIVRLYRGQNNYDFIRLWRWSLRVSIAAVVLSILALGVRGLNLGIDFEGGVAWEVKAPGVTVEQARDALRPLGLTEAKVQTVGRENIRVQAPAESAERRREVQEVLAELAGQPATAVNVSNVGPTWGGEVTRSAVWALVVFLGAIVVYITSTFRGEWKMAIGVVVAVVHDVLVSVGVYALFQFEVTPATVIAFLTILGYSIYDTVVVYDKVQENAHRVGIGQRLTYTGMMNLSMNQVLMRSLNTSALGVLPVVSTLVVGAKILGATTLEEFSVALTVGIFVGAYSSIFVAAPLVARLKESEPHYRQLRERLERAGAAETVVEDGEGAVPVGAAAGAPARPAGELTISPNIPPRPRKKGKRR